MYGSRRKNGRNAVATKVVCVRSSKAVAMKDLAVLQASPSTLAKRALQVLSSMLAKRIV